MAYRQLEQYLGRGEEQVLWLLSYKHAGGGLLGGFLGRFVFNALTGGSVGWAAFGMVAGALVGVALLTQYHGVLLASACCCSPASTRGAAEAHGACMPRCCTRRCSPPRTLCACGSATGKHSLCPAIGS